MQLPAPTTLRMVLFAAIYTAGYFLLTMITLGAEPKGGTPLFICPIVSWPLFFVALFVLRKTGELSINIFFVLILICHYVITVFLVPHFAGGFAMSMSELWRINGWS